MKYRVWATDHAGWWGPNHCGYTSKLEQAGMYTGDEVAEILSNDMLNEPRVCRVGEEDSMQARLAHEAA